MRSELIDYLELLGFAKEQVLKMIKELPTILGYDIYNIKRKIELLKTIGIDSIILLNGNYLMQSVKVTYARYKYFASIGIKIDMENYKKLFGSAKRFENSHGISKEELLNKFKYEKDNDRTIK